MPSSSSTSAEAATSGLPTLHRLTVRLLRSKHRLAACETLCIPAKLTVDKLLDTRCARRRGVHMVPYNVVGCQWLQTMTGMVVCVTMALVAMETAAHGRRCRPFMYNCTVTVLPGSCAIGRVEGQNYRFLKLIAIVTLSLS